MNQLLRIYTDVLGNLFSCFFLLRFTEVETRENISWKNKLFLLIPYTIYSIPEHVPYSTLVCCFIELLFFIKLLYPDIKKILVIFVKYNFFMYLFTILILFVHTYVMQDTNLLATSSAYSEYKPHKKDAGFPCPLPALFQSGNCMYLPDVKLYYTLYLP